MHAPHDIRAHLLHVGLIGLFLCIATVFVVETLS